MSQHQQSSPPQLPDALLWRQDGHLSDEAAVAVADGQLDILPATLLDHVEGCEACADRVAAMAMHSAEMHDWLTQSLADSPAQEQLAAAAELAPAVSAEASVTPLFAADLTPPTSAPAVSRRRPSPRWAIAAALAFALLGMLPSLGMLAGRLAHYQRLAEQLMPALVKNIVALLHTAREPLSGGLMAFLPALLLALAGLAIAWRASRNPLTNGGAHA